MLMIDRSLAPRRDVYMRPENMEIWARVGYIWVTDIYLYVRVFPLHKHEAADCTGPICVWYSICICAGKYLECCDRLLSLF